MDVATLLDVTDSVLKQGFRFRFIMQVWFGFDLNFQLGWRYNIINMKHSRIANNRAQQFHQNMLRLEIEFLDLVSTSPKRC